MTMNHRKRGRLFRQNSAINVTPLVDVMLVLLIIFMVTAPMMTTGVNVDLPKTKTSELSSSSEPLVITMNAEEKIYIQETEIGLDNIIEKISAITGSNKDACVYIRADKNLKYEKVMMLIGLISESGVAKVSLISE